MKRIPTFAAAVLALALALPAASTPANADGWRHHGYRHHDRHHHRHAGYGSGLTLGLVLSRPYYYPPPRPVYVTPPPVYVTPAPVPAPVYVTRVPADCQATTGTGYANGRPALFGGTWCHDAYGRGYVVAGSERFLGYLQ